MQSEEHDLGFQTQAHSPAGDLQTSNSGISNASSSFQDCLMLQSEPEQSVRSHDVKLSAHVRSMIFDRAIGERKFLSNPFTGLS
jgi:hypothetical protein